MKRYYSIFQSGRDAEIYIFGDITHQVWAPGEVSASSFVSQLSALDADTIHVHIDSYGGAVSEGWAIYNALRQHPARIVTYGDGFVASAAMYPFLAGDERIASSLSAYYLHEVMISASGYADDLRSAADDADAMTEIGIRAFVERAGIPEERVRQLMEQESWLTPEQALELGIATKLLADEAPKHTQNARESILQALHHPDKKSKPTIMQLLTDSICKNRR